MLDEFRVVRGSERRWAGRMRWEMIGKCCLRVPAAVLSGIWVISHRAADASIVHLKDLLVRVKLLLDESIIDANLGIPKIATKHNGNTVREQGGERRSRGVRLLRATQDPSAGREETGSKRAFVPSMFWSGQESGARKSRETWHTSPNSFSITATFRPWFRVRMWFTGTKNEREMSGAYFEDSRQAEHKNIEHRDQEGKVCSQRVVFPAPRKPVRTVTGTLSPAPAIFCGSFQE
jgi:hypothetical protein